MGTRLALLAALLALGTRAGAQSNKDPAIDVKIAWMEEINAVGRTGTYPHGLNAVAYATIVCNLGTAQVPWEAAMDPDHPFIAFLLARESNGRLEQISDRSHVKHGYSAANEFGCGGCELPATNTLLGLGCSDTYTVTSNSINYSFGPPEEVDPWLGAWQPTCSFFDRGEPPAAPPEDCDGVRSFTFAQSNALGPVGNLVQVTDSDLAVAGASFYFQGAYVVATEADSVRGDNLGSRIFTASWDGSVWDLVDLGGVVHGSVLQRWSGASVTSVANGDDDGRVYLAVKVTGPVAGLYHYEYALHNRDNVRGIGALSIPVCASAQVLNVGSSDVDDVPGNEWTASVNGGRIRFSTASNPVRWNTIHNFWFDSSAAPDDMTLSLGEFDAGPGLATLRIAGRAPTGVFQVPLGPGCALGTPPSLYATGAPARATLGNPTFAMGSAGNAPGRAHWLFAGLVPGSQSIHGCQVWMGGLLGSSTVLVSRVRSDASGVALHAVPVPDDPTLEGLELPMQALGHRPGEGALLGDFELSDALLVRVGSSFTVRVGSPFCP